MPAGPTYTAETIREFIGAALPSIEIVDHRYHDWKTVGAPSLLADNAIHGAWVAGEPYAGWRDLDFARHPVALVVNGEQTFPGSGAAVLGNPLTVVAWLANELPRFGRRLRRGRPGHDRGHDRHLPGRAGRPAGRRLRPARPRRAGLRAGLSRSPRRTHAMPKAIRIHQTGGPEVLRWEEVEVGEPGEGQARVRHTAVGVNFIDTYHRSGLYPLPLPSGLGSEGAGVVEAVGPGVTRRPAGRPRGLRRRAARVVRRGAADAGRPAGEAPRRHLRPAGRGHDAQGHDGRST